MRPKGVNRTVTKFRNYELCLILFKFATNIKNTRTDKQIMQTIFSSSGMAKSAKPLSVIRADSLRFLGTRRKTSSF